MPSGFTPVVADLRPSVKVTIPWDKPRGTPQALPADRTFNFPMRFRHRCNCEVLGKYFDPYCWRESQPNHRPDQPALRPCGDYVDQSIRKSALRYPEQRCLETGIRLSGN